MAKYLNMVLVSSADLWSSKSQQIPGLGRRRKEPMECTAKGCDQRFAGVGACQTHVMEGHILGLADSSVVGSF